MNPATAQPTLRDDVLENAPLLPLHPDLCRAAVLTVCDRARDMADARYLLDVLGLLDGAQ